MQHAGVPPGRYAYLPFAGTTACRHGSLLDRRVAKATEINERAWGLINEPLLFYIHEKEDFICSRTTLTVSEDE